jgi:hypothetical protein
MNFVKENFKLIDDSRGGKTSSEMENQNNQVVYNNILLELPC